MAGTKIEWADKSWNVITGCAPISEGCAHCYAKRMAPRLAGRYGYPRKDPFRVRFHEDKYYAPLHWKKPQRIFVNSMGDLFHDDVPEKMIMRVWEIMKRANWHTYLILTKRPERMQTVCQRISEWNRGIEPNVWLGVTAENQARADERIPVLLGIPAAKRFVSCEPLLEPILLREEWPDGISWVIVGSFLKRIATDARRWTAASIGRCRDD